MKPETKRRPGRPRPAHPARQISLMLTDRHVRIAEKIGDGNISQGVRTALDTHADLLSTAAVEKAKTEERK